MKNNQLPKDALVSRQLGFGAPPPVAPMQQGLGAAASADACQSLIGCAFGSVPVVEYVTLTIPLPLSDTAISATFGDTINILNSGQSPAAGIASSDSSFAINGILQANMFVIGISMHAFGEPFAFTQLGNAVPTSAGVLPISPDVFTTNDLHNGALGPTAAGSVLPAAVEWGNATWNAIWHLLNGYQFQWTFCQRFLLINELAADVAYCGPFVDGSGMGTSDVLVAQYVKQVNSMYRGLSAGSIFAPVTHRRVGSVNVGGTGGTPLGGNTGVFHPTTDYRLAPVTWGGLHSQNTPGCGQMFRKLTKPILLQQGLPINMKLSAQDQFHVTQMQRYLSVSEGAGTNTTANVQIDGTLNGYTAVSMPAGLELTLDQGGNQFAAQNVDTDTSLFKGGTLKLAMLIKGFEVCGDWCTYLNNNRAALSNSVYMPSNGGGSMAGVGLMR